MEDELMNFALSYLGVGNFDDCKKFTLLMKSFIENSTYIKIKKKEDQIEALKYVINLEDTGFGNRELVDLLEAEIEDLKKKEL